MLNEYLLERLTEDRLAEARRRAAQAARVAEARRVEPATLPIDHAAERAADPSRRLLVRQLRWKLLC